jgi:hypothetical protein
MNEARTHVCVITTKTVRSTARDSADDLSGSVYFCERTTLCLDAYQIIKRGCHFLRCTL